MLSLVVPTFNEALNLPMLAKKVASVLERANIDYELIVADDDSPDDTPAVCEALAKTYPVRLLKPAGRPRDLSLSVIDGVKAATFDCVAVMDADLSHPAETLTAMVDVLKQTPGAFVLGSRYVAGGSFDRSWGLWRFLNSHLATALAKPLVRCSDPMSGFFAFNRRYLGDTKTLKPVGYKIGLELMVRGQFESVVEVPIVFKDRELGTSKLSMVQQFRYLRHLRRLYFHRFRNVSEFIHYGLVGSSGFIVDVSGYLLFQVLGAPHQLARGLSFWPAVSWNWWLNRHTTFAERKKRPGLRQWFEFVVASLCGFTINWGLYVVLTSYSAFFDSNRIVALIVGTGSAALFNFAAASLFVFNEKRQ